MKPVPFMRSLLSVPGNRPSMLEKARGLPADGLHLDLEDAVPPAEKERARETVQELLPGFPLRAQAVVVRVNPLASGLIEADLDAIMGPHLDGISLPKVESPQDVIDVDAMMSEREKTPGLAPGYTGLYVWIETPKAMLAAHAIACSSKRVKALLFGADDFTREMGMPRTRGGNELAFARWTVALAARAARVLAIDASYPDFQDEEGLVRDALAARGVGFQGKFLIHPRQIDPVNRIFLPSSGEIEEARRIVAAFEEAVALGHATTSLDGSMIDTAIAGRARRVLALAEADARKEAGPLA